MAKKKRSRETTTTKMGIELTGLLLILIGIIGIGFGYVGMLIKEFAVFLFGSWWLVFNLYLFGIGLYMLYNKKMPKFFSERLVGLYLIFSVILVASHFTFLDKIGNYADIIKITFDHFMERINTITVESGILNTGNTTIAVGGGLVGALFICCLYFLFAKVGTIIVLTVLSLFGVVMLFNITPNDIFQKLKKVFKHKKTSTSEEDKELIKEEIIKPEPVNDKIIITSLDQVKSNKPKEEVVEAEPILINNKSGKYTLPPISLLNEIPNNLNTESSEYILKNKNILEKVLKDFQILAKVVEIHVGPAVTQYEIVVPAGTKVSRILSINKEMALALAAKDIRIEAPIPGKSTIGIEIPNETIRTVYFREVLETMKNVKAKGGIVVALGKNLMGKPIAIDLTKMPHLLIAGATGSGKSVCVNSIICSIFMNYCPQEVKLVLIDPKKVELVGYNGTPHLLSPVVDNPKEASKILHNIVGEMEKRFTQFSEKRVKKINEYNEKIVKENKKNPENTQPLMPYIVVIIDELADLMLVASKEVEDSIMRITQMARATGIHLIVATQRPSTDVITGIIKANIPSRICFAVASQIDSRTALDSSGAEKLLGKGDMLYLPIDVNTPERIQGCFISDDEIDRLIRFCSKQMIVKYDEEITLTKDNDNYSKTSKDEEYEDPMYDEVVEFAIQTGKISASLIQRKFRFGFNRAARLIDLLESRGIVGPQNGSKPREVLVKLKEEE